MYIWHPVLLGEKENTFMLFTFIILIQFEVDRVDLKHMHPRHDYSVAINTEIPL